MIDCTWYLRGSPNLPKVASYNDMKNKFFSKIGIMRERERERLTWIVFPFMAVTTSPGLTAVPLGIFSHNGINAAKKDNKCTLNLIT